MRRTALAVVAALALAPAAAAATPVATQASFSPLVHGFGDPVVATVAVAADRSVEPGSVRVAASFGPYDATALPVERRAAADGRVLLRFAWRLRCTTSACVPRKPERTFLLPAAHVSWLTRGGAAGRTTALWPALTVASRLTPGDLAVPAFLAQTPPPASGLRLPAGPLSIALLALGSLLAAAGLAALAAPLLRRRRRAPLPVAPLQLALELVERAASGDVDERRRALYQLALLLEEASLEPESWAARKLAWAPATPDPDGMQMLSLVIREQLQEAAT
ncbi:MAG TPA: hypothetical protein VFJ91_05300 [Gaiellaceae bacterium]|nr:hypothetical protein [Gaiellaceae bacterium]